MVEADGKTWRMSKGYRRTTNNRMELMGVIAGLESTASLGKERKTEVVSDSSYVVNGMSKGWARRWRANGWRRNKQGDMALNPDLWGRILDAVDDRDVVFRWVKGHAGHPQNEECDAMVREASRLPKKQQLIDTGYERKGSAPTVEMSPFQSLIETDQLTKPQLELTHIDSSGEARMVDIGDKAITERIGTASCEIEMSAKTLSLIRSGSIGKGDVIATAKLAGVMGGKRTADLIPMCHNIPISQIEVDIEELADGTGLKIEATARANWRTGVEMEAMTAASIAALTVYDMCKSAERGIRVKNLSLLRKSGGKSGDYVR